MLIRTSIFTDQKMQALAPEDYYINEDGLFVFTKEYHLKRGYCCKSDCKHCPWDYKKNKEQAVKDYNKK